MGSLLGVTGGPLPQGPSTLLLLLPPGPQLLTASVFSLTGPRENPQPGFLRMALVSNSPLVVLQQTHPGCWMLGRGRPGLRRDEAAGCGSSNLNCWLLPPQLPTNRQPRLRQRPDSADGDLSAERREGREEEQSLSGQSLGGEHSFQAARDRKGGTAAWGWGWGEFLAWGRGWFSPIAE